MTLSTKFLYLDSCLYSPFDFPIYITKLKNNGYLITKKLDSANLIVSSYYNKLVKYVKKYGNRKRYLLWTHEPYHDWHFDSLVKEGNVKVHIMNCYTLDVFSDNFRYFYFKNTLALLDSVDDKRKRKIVALSTCYPKEFYQKNPKTLLPLRYKIMESGYQKGILDVYGRGWDNHKVIKSLSNSRNDRDRRLSKNDILGGYMFNLCMENTDQKYYVTEKIWESIANYCLPIYYSNDIGFDKDSFIDVREYDDIDQLFDHVEKMTLEEYLSRMNKCINVFNRLVEEGHWKKAVGGSKNLNINYLDYESCYGNLLKKLKKIV